MAASPVWQSPGYRLGRRYDAGLDGFLLGVAIFFWNSGLHNMLNYGSRQVEGWKREGGHLIYLTCPDGNEVDGDVWMRLALPRLAA